MMNRRDFVNFAGLGALSQMSAARKSEAASLHLPASAQGRESLRMRLGTQRGPIDAELLQFFSRHGVEGICIYPKISEDGRWNPEEILRIREMCESKGIRVELLGGALTSAGIEKQVFPNILLGRDPEREREIDLFCEMIAVAAQVEVPCIKYNLAVLPVLRTRPTMGRGGSSYSTWSLSEAAENLPLTQAGVVEADMFWKRITYFVERMLAVATEHRIRMACHPHDPGVPAGGYRGIERVLGTVEGLRRFIDISPSPFHGLNLCIGTVAEMLQNPKEEISAVVREFGERDKIFNIHFRNIRGKRDSFQEVFPDEGDLDMFQLMQVLKEIDYPYLIMPDHMPRHPDDKDGRQAFAFAYGYIKGLLQALSSTA